MTEHRVVSGGRLHRINISDGGVPKTAIEEGTASVGERGIVGDRQGNRNYHGRPWQALSLWSLEVIDALRAEGHHVDVGEAGENLTIAGLDWASLASGLRLRIGDEVIAVLTEPAPPCRKIAHLFADRQLRRIDHDHHPGWSRWYASVVQGGTIRPGDAVSVER